MYSDASSSSAQPDFRRNRRPESKSPRGLWQRLGAKTRWKVLVATVTLVGVTLLLLVPRPELLIPGGASRQAELVPDYLVHFSLYFVLTVAVFAPVTSWEPRVVLALLGLVALHGLLTEWAQAYIPHRQCELTDVLANLAGIGCAAMFTLLRPWPRPERVEAEG